MESILVGVIAFGLHGINPSHGWPLAILYSIRTPNPIIASITSSGIIQVHILFLL